MSVTALRGFPEFDMEARRAAIPQLRPVIRLPASPATRLTGVVISTVWFGLITKAAQTRYQDVNNVITNETTTNARRAPLGRTRHRTARLDRRTLLRAR